MKDIIESWDKKASQWREWTGTRGDNNRFFHSDPVLLNWLGDVREKTVLDAGCGTGYLSVLIAKKAAKVIAVDFSPKMISEARALAALQDCEIEFKTESTSELKSIDSESIDLIVSNYVLMDLPDLDGAVNNFFRVLRPGGKAVLVFSHPGNSRLLEGEMYFDEIKKTERWGPFDSDFIFFHRPLSQYWKVFRKAGFRIEEFDEPVAKSPDAPGFKEEWRNTYRKTAWSVAFLLAKA